MTVGQALTNLTPPALRIHCITVAILISCCPEPQFLVDFLFLSSIAPIGFQKFY